MTIPFVETDYLELSRSRYTEQFKDKPVFDAYIKIFIDEITELRDVLKDIKTLRDIDTATGVQLDVIGEIVGQPRVLVDFTLFPYFGFEGSLEGQTFGTYYDSAIGGFWKSIADKEGEDFTVDDDTYRFLIRARIAANIANSTPQGVMDAVNFILGRTDTEIEETGDAHVTIKYGGTLTALQDYFLRGLSSIGSIIPLPICVSYTLQEL